MQGLCTNAVQIPGLVVCREPLRTLRSCAPSTRCSSRSRSRTLTLRNRVVSTSHEPAYAEDGMPKERYRLYHLEKARGGVGLTMIGGSAVVAPDSPPSFGNLLLYKDEIVPWLRRLTDDVHEAGAAVMCQVTHLGRRTSNFTGDWLPVVYASPLREPAHRSFPKVAEPWDLDRIVDDYVAAAERCVAAGLDGIELQSYGHLLDGFLSPATNRRNDELGGEPRGTGWRSRAAWSRRCGQRSGPTSSSASGCRWTRTAPTGLGRDEALQALRAATSSDGIDFLSVIRGHDRERRDAGAGDPLDGHAVGAASSTSPARSSAPSAIPVMHASRISDVATARHAIRDGLLDLVGMTRPQMADPHLVAQGGRRRGGPDPALRRRQLLPRRDLPVRRRQVHPQPRHRPRADAAATWSRRRPRARKAWSSAPAPPGWRRPGCSASGATRSWCSRRPTCPAGRCGWPRRRPAGAT